MEVPAALSTGAATDVAKPLKVLIAGIESAVGIRWVDGSYTQIRAQSRDEIQLNRVVVSCRER